MDEDVKIIATVDISKQESLNAEAEVDPMEGEQTWPTDEELREADGLFLLVITDKFYSLLAITEYLLCLFYLFVYLFIYLLKRLLSY